MPNDNESNQKIAMAMLKLTNKVFEKLPDPPNGHHYEITRDYGQEVKVVLQSDTNEDHIIRSEN
jgi:hypothetical protein